MTKVFAIARGQFENIGDIILRRQLLDWVRPVGELHVYVGQSPHGYDEGLRLAPTDRVHRSLSGWYREALRSAARGEAAFVFKPGEIQLTLVGMKEHVSMLPLLATLRARGGAAVRAGVGTRNYARVPRALMRPSIALSDRTLWRDVTTGEYMGTGAVMPDLAFGEGPDDGVVKSFVEPSPDRDALVVSLRGDDPLRPYPSGAWLEGVRRHAARHDLEIWAVTQVRSDDDLTRQLATDLGGRALTWDAQTPHAEQERRLRELFARAELALSDRLHVAITAFTEGAVPVGALVQDSDKVDRHFRTIGIDGISMPASGSSADEVAAGLAAASTRRAELFRCLLDARGRLQRHRDDVQQVLGRGRLAEDAPVAGKVAG